MHVYEVLRDTVRRRLDCNLLERAGRERAWNIGAVQAAYADGIDWEYLRTQLRTPSLTPSRRRALQIVSAAAVWSDERRWLAGYAEEPTCTTCYEKVGDDEHFYGGECEGVQVALWWENLAGRPQQLPEQFSEPALAPLTQLCWPPRVGRWLPVEKREDEGHLTMSCERSFGDGSGYRQRLRRGRVATWAVTRIDEAGTAVESLRGVVDGYFSTVPRGEIKALIAHLRHAGPAAVYVGDCQHVLDAARHGVPPRLLAARSANPDLWAEVDRLLRDHGAPMELVKVKAHASREAALAYGTSPLDWMGNIAADAHCRELARDIAAQDELANSLADRRAAYGRVYRRVIFVAQWALRYRPQYAKGPRGRRRSGIHQGGSWGVEGAHQFVESRNGRWFCRLCRREAWTRENFEKLKGTECSGHVAKQCHRSHRLRVHEGILWCTLCGAYTSRQPRALARPCLRRPTSAAAANVRCRLARGLPPTTAPYLAYSSITTACLVAPRAVTAGGSEAQVVDANAEVSECDPAHERLRLQSEASGGDTCINLSTLPERAFRCAPCGGGGQYVGHLACGLLRPFGLRHVAMHGVDARAAAAYAELAKAVIPSGGDDDDGHDDVAGISQRSSAPHAAAAHASSRYLNLDKRRARFGAAHFQAAASPVSHSSLSAVQGSATSSARLAGGPFRRQRQGTQPLRSAASLCQPLRDEPWTQRLEVTATAVAQACELCRSPCRGRCAGCQRPLCLPCARAKTLRGRHSRRDPPEVGCRWYRV